MKKALIITTTVLASLNGASATTMDDLAKCVNAFSGQSSLNSSGYTTMLTPTKNARTQLLVLNKDGAKVVEPFTQDQDYIFQIPGKKQFIKQQWLLENNTFTPAWDSKESPTSKASNAKDINVEEATKLAVDGLKLTVTQKSSTLQTDLQQLDRWVRLRHTGNVETDILSSGSKKLINEERLFSQLLLVNKGIEDLSSCKNVSDPKIQELVKIELGRLKAFKNKIGDLKRESKKFSGCVSKISTNKSGTGSLKNSSSQGAR